MRNFAQVVELAALLPRARPSHVLRFHEWQPAWLAEEITVLAQGYPPEVIHAALILCGYDPERRWSTNQDGASVAYFGQANWARQAPTAVQMARELMVRGTAVVRDGETLVYLQMIGPRAAVRANWAAAKGGNKRPWLGNGQVLLRKGEHHCLQQTLPCGWDELVLLHRQASLATSHGEQPLYLIGSDRQCFMAQMMRGIHVPLKSEWADYLWVVGVMSQLITPLEECVGHAGWRINVGEAWEAVVSDGLRQGQIHF